MTAPFRVGQGIDIHRFTTGDHVMLCGVRIAHDQGVLAHSDGDVALHAVCDALLGALALGDIGQHFPDTDPRWRGADSRHLLRHVHTLLQERSYRVAQLDLCVLAERPRIAPHVAQMRENLASDLAMVISDISVKATTCEGLGAIGRREGLMAQAICLLVSA